MKNKNRKMSNKAKRLNVLKILLFVCFGFIGHRLLNRHAYELLTPSARTRVDNTVVNGNGSNGKNTMVLDKITNFGNSQPNPWPYVVGQSTEPYICASQTFKPQHTTDGEESGGHTNPTTCSTRISTWCSRADCAVNKNSYTFPIMLSRALHYIQDMCCAVHVFPITGTSSTFYSGYSDNQVHDIYEMKDASGSTTDRYNLTCDNFGCTSYSELASKIPGKRSEAENLMNKTTGEFFTNNTLRNRVANELKKNVTNVMNKFKIRTASNATTIDNEIRTILLDDLARSAALMERCIKGSCLSKYFSINFI